MNTQDAGPARLFPQESLRLCDNALKQRKALPRAVGQLLVCPGVLPHRPYGRQEPTCSWADIFHRSH